MPPLLIRPPLRPLLALALGLGLLRGAEATPDPAATYDRTIRPFLTTYCGACHDAKKHKGDVDFSSIVTGSQALGQLSLWRSVGAQLAAKDMPPSDGKQPSEGERTAFATWLKALKGMQKPDPGASIIRRLSRIEYRNTMHDLLGVELDAGADLPPDQPGAGFDNSLSPLLAEKYLLAADAVLDRVIVPEQVNLHFLAGQLPAIVAGKPDAAKDDGSDRLFSTPGEILTAVTVPVEGTYTIRLRAGAEAAGGEPVRLAVRIDGKVINEFKITATPGTKAAYTCTTRLGAGRSALSILYANPLAPTLDAPVAKTPASPGTASITPPTAPGKKSSKEPTTKTRSVVIDTIDLLGPPAKPPSEVQRRLFVPMPGKDVSRHDAAQRILETFALRAYRRPPRPDEVALLMSVFDIGETQDLVFSESMKLAFKAVLISPQFLYRTPDDDAPAAGAVVPIGDYELASRMSYFLWSTMPDEELLRLAHDGTLHQPAILAAQTRRLLLDPRARTLGETFAAPWLGLDRVADLVVDPKRFPMMNPELRQAMYDEGLAYFVGLLQDGGTVLELLDGDYAWMNGLTARTFYGNTEVKGPKMQKVRLSDANRGGVMTMPGVLAVTSMPSRTSPVKRGKWILEQLLDAAPPPPPPNVPDLSKQDTAENAKLTLRQRTERHRTDPACAACHRIMDPLGFGLENFDPIGRWRTLDDYGSPVDALGELPGRQRFTSPAELRRILLERKADFVRAFTGRLLAFALGRRLSGYDEVVVDGIAEAALAQGGRLDDLIIRITGSYPFLNRHALR